MIRDKSLTISIHQSLSGFSAANATARGFEDIVGGPMKMHFRKALVA